MLSIAATRRWCNYCLLQWSLRKAYDQCHCPVTVRKKRAPEPQNIVQCLTSVDCTSHASVIVCDRNLASFVLTGTDMFSLRACLDLIQNKQATRWRDFGRRRGSDSFLSSFFCKHTEKREISRCIISHFSCLQLMYYCRLLLAQTLEVSKLDGT